MRIGDACVSTRDQNLALQENALRNAGCEKVFTEIASGSTTARPALDDLLTRLREGDGAVLRFTGERAYNSVNCPKTACRLQWQEPLLPREPQPGSAVRDAP